MCAYLDWNRYEIKYRLAYNQQVELPASIQMQSVARMRRQFVLLMARKQVKNWHLIVYRPCALVPKFIRERRDNVHLFWETITTHPSWCICISVYIRNGGQQRWLEVDLDKDSVDNVWLSNGQSDGSLSRSMHIFYAHNSCFRTFDNTCFFLFSKMIVFGLCRTRQQLEYNAWRGGTWQPNTLDIWG